MNRRHRNVLAAVAAGALLATATPVGANETASSVRIAGRNRYTTSHGVAANAWAGRDVNVAVLTTGTSFADALAANYLAGAVGSPILLNGVDAMDPGLPGALEAIGAEGVQVIGGTSAISDAVLDELRAAGFEASRLAGEDRFATARAVAEVLPGEAVGEFEANGRTAIIANGNDFADAVAAGTISYSQGWPVLLTGADRLHGHAGEAIVSLGIQHAIVLGGTAAVSEAAMADLTTLGLTTQRLAGDDRAQTARAIAEFALESLGYGADDVIIVRGDSFADALAAGPRGGDEVQPILLTVSSTDLGLAAAAFLVDHAPDLVRLEVFGGTAAISEQVEADALALARGQS